MPDAGPAPDATNVAIGKADGHVAGPTVAQAVHDPLCCTNSVEGLSRQLLDELECLLEEQELSDGRGALFASLDMPGVELGDSCPTFPYAQRALVHALGHALEGARGLLSITSSTRTLAQQYILRRWDRLGRCGVLAAAEPGNSKHESGLAIDVERDDEGSFKPRLTRQGFRTIGGDPGHFEYCDSGGSCGINLGDLSVRAFQRLWNHNHDGVDNAGRPNGEEVDPIAEDGDFGPITRDRLERSPAGGFPGGTACAATRGTEPCNVASCWGMDLDFPGCTDFELDEDYSSQSYNVHRYPVSLSPEGTVAIAVERMDPEGAWQPALVVTDGDGTPVFDGTAALPHDDLDVIVVAQGDQGPTAALEITAHRGVDLAIHVTSHAVRTEGYHPDTLPPDTALYRLTLGQSCEP